MGTYTLYDFTETLNRVDLNGAKPVSVISAWGYSPEGGGSWKGGFLVLLDNGQQAYMSGWCDFTGWGCQDGAHVIISEQITPGMIQAVDMEPPHDWDVAPSDLNKWIAEGMKDPYQDDAEFEYEHDQDAGGSPDV
jgi:hypothetical protein